MLTRLFKRQEVVCNCEPISVIPVNEISAEDVEKIIRAFYDLPLENQQIVAAKICSRKTEREIGQSLHLAQSTISNRYRRALNQMARAVES